MKTISIIQVLLMSLAIGVAFSSNINPRDHVRSASREHFRAIDAKYYYIPMSFPFQMCLGRLNGELLPNRMECSSYYVCSYGKAHLFNCSLDLLYDVDLNVCNWPNKVSCRQVLHQVSQWTKFHVSEGIEPY